MDSKQLPNMLVRTLGYFVSGLIVLISTQAQANSFYGSIGAVSGVSDNALKTEENTLSERQDQYSLAGGGKWNNEWLAFDMGYDATAQTFSEHSQEEKNFLEGSSSLMLGKDSQPANLFLQHSRTTLLSAPDSVNLTQNQDEKDVFSAKPTLRQHISPVDNILLNGEYTRINYLENDLKDSRREGGSLVLDHKFSALSDIQLSAQQTAIDFKLSPDSNYTYRSVGVTYSVKLRKISYSVTAGTNKTSPEVGEEYSSPSYALSFAYDAGGQKFSLSARRELTDTSAGGGNILPQSDLPTSDGAGVGLDQIERKTYGANWSTFALCQSCTFSLGAIQTTDDYLNLTESEKEQSWNAGFIYALSTASSVSLRYADGIHKYTQVTLGRDYKIQTAHLEYAYQFNHDFGLNFILRKEKRDGDAAAQTYSESYVGAGINYKF